MKRLEGVDGGYWERSGVFVLMVKFMEIPVEEGEVIESVRPVGQVILVDENDWGLEDQPPPRVLEKVVVDGGVTAVVYVAG